MERLVQWLTNKVAEGKLRAVRASKQGPSLSYLFSANDLLIFTEAVEDQLACVREGLDQFCKCSGQQVNFEKSSMFISPNIPAMEVDRLSGCMGFQLKKKLGKYFGHIIVKDGKNRERNKELLHRVHARLEGWKLSYLSRARRNWASILAQLVMESLLIFHMQLEQIPSWVHKELDKATRRCIHPKKATRRCVWGTKKGARGVHLLSWEVLRKPKELGGVNMKLAKDMNRAIMAKLAQRLLTCSGEAWCEVLCSKYGLKKEDDAHLRRKQRSSQVCRGAIWGAELL